MSKYLNHYVVDFLTKKNIKYFRLWKWSENGMNLSLIKTGKYNGERIHDLIPKEIERYFKECLPVPELPKLDWSVPEQDDLIWSDPVD